MSDCTCVKPGEHEDARCPQHGLIPLLQRLSDAWFDDRGGAGATPARLTNPRRSAVCETRNCHAPSVRQVVNIADNTTGWYCDDCSSELAALYPFLEVVVP